MKLFRRGTAIAVCAFLLLSLFSCGKTKENESTHPTTNEAEASDTTETLTDQADTTKTEYADPAVFPISETVTYKDSATEFSAPRNSISVCSENGECKISQTDNTELCTLSDVTLPFGIKCGDSFDSVCRKAGIKTGYALYGEIGKNPETYDENAARFFDGTRNGVLMFGFSVTDDENAVAIDVSMLGHLISGKVLTSYELDTVFFSMSFDKDGRLINSTETYSDYDVFKEIIK